MRLNTEELIKISKIAISAAEQAGELISEQAKKEITVNMKTGGDSLASQVVTEVDLMSQEIILKVLQPVCDEFDIAVLSEESPDDKSRFIKDYFWCIDPIDGTLSFIKGTHGYAVSIGLISKEGESVIGVIYDPMTKTLYHAVKGQGAYRNHKKWQLPDLAKYKNKSLHFYNDPSFKDHPLYQHTLDELEAMSKKVGFSELKTVIRGGAALNACWVLEKAPACYFKYVKKQDGGGSLWDYAASSCIYPEAGGWVSDIYGNPLDLNRADSTFLNHCGVIYASTKDIADEIQKIYKKLNEVVNP